MAENTNSITENILTIGDAFAIMGAEFCGGVIKTPTRNPKTGEKQ